MSGLIFVISVSERARRRSAANLMTRDEARRIAINIAKLACRRFPPPWMIDDNGSCFIVKDEDRAGARFPEHTHARAREKSLNFFAFEQQQMGNWPINCCDALGSPISAGSF